MSIEQALVWYGLEHAPDVEAPRAIGTAIDHLSAWWGTRVVAEITKATVSAYRRHRESTGRGRGLRKDEPSAGVSPATVDRELVVLRAAVNWAHENGRLTTPLKLETGPQRPSRDRWLTVSEAARLLWQSRQSPAHIQLFTALALYTGARHAAIVDLTWDQVDLQAGTIRYLPVGRTQTAKQRPTVPIPRPLLRLLKKARNTAKNPYVITWRNKPVESCRTGFRTLVTRAGLAGVTPHVLRHTAGTWMAQRGVDTWQISGFLGHSEARTTALYKHHSPNFLGQARAAMEGRRRR
ncbi:integrase [Azospirillum agricola]|uniref:tyrosine-type recombinase/integrase n=1 Tax=Azospirillum agricola TaxID=1720247 RepID=UPI001AE3C5F4|nr:site-specific integrase [Azospirillum agricola]MBP2233128.1 integrase [Azospirillum agricola]